MSRICYPLMVRVMILILLSWKPPSYINQIVDEYSFYGMPLTKHNLHEIITRLHHQFKFHFNFFDIVTN